MEKDINELELEEYKKNKDKIIDALTQFESVVDDNGNTSILPLFRVGQNYKKKINQLDDINDEYSALVTTYDEEASHDGFEVKIDKDNYITAISDKLAKYQNFYIQKHINKDKILNDKVKAFNDVNISCKAAELNDVLNIDLDQIKTVVNQDGEVDSVQYESIYTKYLNLYLDALSKNNKVSLFESDDHSLKQTLNDFDNYFKGLVEYTVSTPEIDNIELPGFGGLRKKTVCDYAKHFFTPNGIIEIEPDFHNKNHLAQIKQYTVENKDLYAKKCEDGVMNLVDDYKKHSLKTEKDKVALLLQTREYITFAEKIYKSYNIFQRVLGLSGCKKYDHIRTNLIKEISTATEISEKDCEKFFKNTQPVISYKDKVYDYNQIYKDSKVMEENIEKFAGREAVEKVNLEVKDVDNLSKDLLDIQKVLDKQKEVDLTEEGHKI